MSDTGTVRVDIGAQLPQPDARGWLVFEHLPPDLQKAEDQTAHGDWLRRQRYIRRWQRAATDAERALLEHLGYDVPDDLVTVVHWVSGAVRNRTWPQLEGTNDA